MNKYFGIRLKELRTDRGLTQIQLSNFFNVSKTTICQWETKKQEPCLDDIVKISQFFNVSTDYLLGVEEDSINKIHFYDQRQNKGVININNNDKI